MEQELRRRVGRVIRLLNISPSEYPSNMRSKEALGEWVGSMEEWAARKTMSCPLPRPFKVPVRRLHGIDRS